MAEAVTGNPFLDGLLERAPSTPSQPRRGQNYNYPLRRYLLPDGRVEMLQGDPHNRAYYEDKGYHLMSDLPGRAGGLSEVDQYVQVEYPKILAEQREKAKIINSIRRREDRNPNENLSEDWDTWDVARLRDYLRQIEEETGKPVRMLQEKRRAETSSDARLLSGVETTDQTSIEALEQRRQQRPRS